MNRHSSYECQQSVPVKSPKTIVYRDNPPKKPPTIPEETILIPGRVLPPPPRQVIIERYIYDLCLLTYSTEISSLPSAVSQSLVLPFSLSLL